MEQNPPISPNNQVPSTGQLTPSLTPQTQPSKPKRIFRILAICVVALIGVIVLYMMYIYAIYSHRDSVKLSVDKFEIPGAKGAHNPFDLVVGPDNQIWFTYYDSVKKIGRMKTDGSSAEIASVAASMLVNGNDGKVWSVTKTEIVSITPEGKIDRLPLSQGLYGSEGLQLHIGHKGERWVSGSLLSKIGYLKPGGSLTLISLPNTYKNTGALVGSDGNLWLTVQTTNEFRSDALVSVRPDGRLSTFKLPTPTSGYDLLKLGSDKNLWYPVNAFGGQNKIGRVTTQGQFSEFNLPAGYSADWMTLGREGSLWVTLIKHLPLSIRFRVGEVTPSGQINTFDIPKNINPGRTFNGPDGSVWLSGIWKDSTGYSTGRIDPKGKLVQRPLDGIPSAVGCKYPLAGPDGNLWYVTDGKQICRITLKK